MEIQKKHINIYKIANAQNSLKNTLDDSNFPDQMIEQLGVSTLI